MLTERKIIVFNCWLMGVTLLGSALNFAAKLYLGKPLTWWSYTAPVMLIIALVLSLELLRNTAEPDGRATLKAHTNAGEK